MEDLIIRFNQKGTWNAFHAACLWCSQNGYSYGPMQAKSPIGILKGKSFIAKWRNLNTAERNVLNGMMLSGDFSEGPILIIIRKGA